MNRFTAKSLFHRLKPSGFSILQQQRTNFIKPTLKVLPSPSNSRILITSQQRFYSAEGGLSRQTIEARIIDILKGFDKVDPTKVSSESRFTDDLGLDSLDTVEVVMNIEEDFSIEIPDKEADEIRSIKDAVDYIAKREDAH
ncbi:1735_t:CDS:2 [Funneliformis mosseae]|uniref:Acyl carrier protein n=1 Tax=Funneliformis mosseae TaxID=27381 RepID=A0A9N9FC23_FUNMO|nr:1735_t:CDS:2 [Funneliformis mosseae]